MPDYMVSVRLTADNSDEVITRVASWELSEQEGVISISAQPEVVQVPQELLPPPIAMMSPAMPAEAPLPEAKSKK